MRTLTASAQGTAFTYQGRLSDGTNTANGLYDLTFTLFDTSVSGSPVAGPLTNSAVEVNNGLFTASVDFGQDVFTGSPRWLEIGVRANGDVGPFNTLSPRQQITSTPYAIQSLNAASAVNVSGLISAAQLTGTITGNGSGLTNLNLVGVDKRFNVLDYGATGGNIVADTAAFQAASEAAWEKGGWVYVPAIGIPYYISNSFVWPNRATNYTGGSGTSGADFGWCGDTMGSSVVYYLGINQVLFSCVSQPPDLENIALVNMGGGSNSCIISTNSACTNTRFKNAYIRDWYFGADLAANNGMVIEGCEFYHNYIHLRIGMWSDNAYIVGNRFDYTWGGGLVIGGPSYHYGSRTDGAPNSIYVSSGIDLVTLAGHGFGDVFNFYSENTNTIMQVGYPVGMLPDCGYYETNACYGATIIGAAIGGPSTADMIQLNVPVSGQGLNLIGCEASNGGGGDLVHSLEASADSPVINITRCAGYFFESSDGKKTANVGIANGGVNDKEAHFFNLTGTGKTNLFWSMDPSTGLRIGSQSGRVVIPLQTGFFGWDQGSTFYSYNDGSFTFGDSSLQEWNTMQFGSQRATVPVNWPTLTVLDPTNNPTLSFHKSVAIESDLRVTNNIVGMRGIQLPQFAFLPTNSIPASDCANLITNLLWCNLTNTIGPGGLVAIYTNDLDGTIHFLKPTLTDSVWTP